MADANKSSLVSDVADNGEVGTIKLEPYTAVPFIHLKLVISAYKVQKSSEADIKKFEGKRKKQGEAELKIKKLLAEVKIVSRSEKNTK